MSSEQYFCCPYNDQDACVWGHRGEAGPNSDMELGHGGKIRSQFGHRARLQLKSYTLLETEQGP